MSNYLNSHLGHYAVFSPHLSSARVVTVDHPTFHRRFDKLQFAATGLLVGAVIGMGAYLVQMRSSALTQTQETPIVSQPTAEPKVEPVAPAPAPAPAAPAPAATPAPAPKPKPAPTTLQGVVENWNSETSGTFGVSIIELGGAGRTASLNANKQFRSASLYKLYLAHNIYDQVAKGTLSLNDTLGMNKTVGQCIGPMIVISDNYCGEAMGNAIGWTTLHNFARASGFSGTTLSPGNLTTSADMANFLRRLHAGTLITNPAHKDQLIGFMGNQVYRQAIPAGVPGVAVANKVGFLPGVWNDAAIVYGPKSTYVMVVMTTGNPTAIKDLSKRVAAFLNQ